MDPNFKDKNFKEQICMAEPRNESRKRKKINQHPLMKVSISSSISSASNFSIETLTEAGEEIKEILERASIYSGSIDENLKESETLDQINMLLDDSMNTAIESESSDADSRAETDMEDYCSDGEKEYNGKFLQHVLHSITNDLKILNNIGSELTNESSQVYEVPSELSDL